MAGPLGAAIAQLVRQAKPDRLIIEPSGLGHPAGLLDTLQNEHLRSALEIRAIICMVDVRQVGSASFESNETYQDQVNVCDIIIGTKADLVVPHSRPSSGEQARGGTGQQTAEIEHIAQQLKSHKVDEGGEGGGADAAGAASGKRGAAAGFGSASGGGASAGEREAAAGVVIASHGQLSPELLNLSRAPIYQPFFTGAHKGGGARRRAGKIDNKSEEAVEEVEGEPASLALDQLQPGKPHRIISAGSAEHVACGWVVSKESVFDKKQLSQLLLALHPHCLRLKGVFRVGPKSWVVPKFTESEGATQHLALEIISYRRESRMEVIVKRPGKQATAGGVGKEDNQGDQVQEGLNALPTAIAACDWDAVEFCLTSTIITQSAK
eukprot:gene26159-11886_t